MARSLGEWELFGKVVWNRPAFRVLSADARVLYFWTWTAPGRPLSGIGPASPRALERALEEAPGGDALLRERVRSALVELARKPLVLYDDDAEVLWVVGRVEHALRSPAMAVRMRREWESCPPSPLRDRFAEAYGHLLELVALG